MNKWKVTCLVGQGDRLIGYDMVSSLGEQCTVNQVQLTNAIRNGGVVNAFLVNGKIVVQEPVNKRVEEKKVNIQLTESEFLAYYPYIEKLYSSLIKDKENNKKVLQALQRFVQVNIILGEGR